MIDRKPPPALVANTQWYRIIKNTLLRCLPYSCLYRTQPKAKNLKPKPFPVIILCGADSQIRPKPSQCSGFWITHNSTHTHTHARTQTKPVGIPCTSDQLIAEAATYTSHSKHKRRTSANSAGFDPTLSTVRRQQTYVLIRTPTGTDTYSHILINSVH